MFRTLLLFITFGSFQLILTAQPSGGGGKHLPQPTPAGIGKIDTRIDNMRYWRRMADSGFVFVAPVESLPSAIFTGSRIEHPMVMTVNSPDIPTTNQNSTQSENSVFINPTNNQAILNSNNSTTNPVGSLYGADYLLSFDGGTTWGGSISGAGGSNSGDPAAAISLTGRQYIGFINSNGGQSVSYSNDNGNTWTSVVAGAYNGGLCDKNHMWIDNSPLSPHEGNLYSAWTDFGSTNTFQIVMVRSVNDGLEWSSPVNLSSSVYAGSHNQGVNIQTGPNGQVYAIWSIYDSWPSDETAIGFAKSTDGGVSFGSGTRIINNIRGIRTTETTKNHRVNSFPSMAVDISGGPNNGNIYIVWANYGVPGVNTGPGIDVYMIRSTNQGFSWSAPIRVNQDPPGSGKQHYFPWITCDPVTGELSVIFYDDRNVSPTQCEVFVAYSFNAGNTWADFKVSDVAFTPAGIPGLAGGYMGDYLGIAARDSRIYPVWTDNRTGVARSYVSPFVLSTAPIANFGVSATTPCLNQTAQFQDMTLKTPVSWLWNITPSGYSYVNGTGPTSQNPQVKFNSYGNYTVQLIATNGFGSDTLVRTNYISVNYANADFNSDINMVFVENNVIFTDQSNCNISSYSWNFGAGATPATANTQGPHTVSYSTTGFKTVSLTVNGNVTKTKSNYIEVLPESFNMSNGTLLTCSGIFYDPQGTSSYLNNQNFTMTLMPGDTSKSIQADFTAFALEAGVNCASDWLRIYDGTSTSDSLLGSFCGTNSPGTVVAYKASGALTFHFRSDASVVAQGWAANISCVETPPPPPTTYCLANASGGSEYISRVQMGSIDNTTGWAAGRYANYTSLITRVSPEESHPITITNGSLSWPGDQCGIWIDWNHDFDFSDPGEAITVTGSPGIGPYTANIIPPANAAKGLTRMRIRIMWVGTLNACGTINYGEVEDYSVYVGTPGLWVGGTAGFENDWNTPENWDDGQVPCPITNVIIPETAFYYPESSGAFNCFDLQIKDGAIVTIQPGSILNINGDLHVGQGTSGIMYINGGTCNISGTITTFPGSIIYVSDGGGLINYE
jgi:PKD repeat protein